VNLEIVIDDHGLEGRLHRAAPATGAILRRFALEIRDAAYEGAVKAAPERGDFRRGPILGKRGNLKRAITKNRVTTIPLNAEDAIYEGGVFVDQKKAPYAKWVVYGSGPKKVKKSTARRQRRNRAENGITTGSSVPVMVFPETRIGFPARMWVGRTFRGNPVQDFIAVGGMTGRAFMHVRAPGIAAQIGNLSHLTQP
jgi:hypothetical protein